MPDLRGLFLRGYGGKSSTLLSKQNEAVHIDSSVDVAGEITFKSGLEGVDNGTSYHNKTPSYNYGYAGTGQTGNVTLEVTGLKISVSTDDETRPVNMAVRYLIRALP